MNGSWYLIGRDHDRDDIRQFKLGRVRRKIHFAGEVGSFRTPAGFRVNDHVKVQPWAMGERGGRPVHVRVLLDRAIAWFSEGPFASKEADERPDGSVVLSFDVLDEPAFMRWLLQHARHVHVLEPKRLKDRFAKLLDKLATAHE